MRKLEIGIINEIEAVSVIPDHSKLVKLTADSNIKSCIMSNYSNS